MKKWLALFLGRVIPLGMTGAFLQTSYSPIKPALNAFRAATAALSGEAVEDSGAGALIPKGDARTQLDQIIADVKANGGAAPGTGQAQVNRSNPHKPTPRAQTRSASAALPPPPPAQPSRNR